MDQKELLRAKIEEERKKLNDLLAGGIQTAEAYEQSRVVDKLIEQYMEL